MAEGAQHSHVTAPPTVGKGVAADAAAADTAASSWVAEARAALAGSASWRDRVARIPTLKPREIVALTVLVIAILAGAGLAFVRAMPREAADAPAVRAIAPEPSPTPGVVVYVTGAVRRPGVYDLPPGSRVVDALDRAGGALAVADLNALNLAAPLADGSKIYVPRRGEAASSAEPATASGGDATAKVNINSATVAELDARLPGVGPVLAQRIVDYRTQHGLFRSVNDLLKVEGIGQKKFDSLKDFVTV